MKMIFLIALVAAGVLIFLVIQPPELGVKKLPATPAAQTVSAVAPDPLTTPTPKPRSASSIEMYERWARETLASKSASKADREKAMKHIEEVNRLRAGQ
jgi:hypothetical protein